MEWILYIIIAAAALGAIYWVFLRKPASAEALPEAQQPERLATATTHYMEEEPKTRDELIEDLRYAMIDSGEDPNSVARMLSPENLKKLSDEEIIKFSEKYTSIGVRAAKLNTKIRTYNAALDKDMAEAEKRMRAAGKEIIADILAERKNKNPDPEKRKNS